MLNKPKTKNQVVLTPEQAAAYAKLAEGLRAVACLGAPDLETLTAWLDRGDHNLPTIIYQVSRSAIQAVQEYDDQAYDVVELWDEVIQAELLRRAG